MTTIQKVINIIRGILGIVLGAAMIKLPDAAYVYLVMLIGLGLLVYGISTLIYYFTMAMFMIEGKTMLYKGVIITDFAILTLSLADVPRFYVMIYLIALHAFSGFVEILRAVEAKRYGGRSWRIKLGHGLVNIGICVFCLINLKAPNTVVIIYGLGLVYSGIMHLLSAIRRNTFYTFVFIR